MFLIMWYGEREREREREREEREREREREEREREREREITTIFRSPFGQYSQKWVS